MAKVGFRLQKGLASFKKKAKEREAQFKPGRFVYLKEDERARIRFLTDADDFVHGVFHQPTVNSKPLDPVLCIDDRGAPDDIPVPDVCPICEHSTGNWQDAARQQFFAWVFVYYVLHPKQNPKAAESDDAKKTWTPVTVGQRTMFKQDINGVRLLKGGPKMLEDLEILYGELSTLLGQDFSFIRSGSGLDTTYTFIPSGKQTADKPEVVKAVEALEDLSVVYLEGTRTYFQGEEASVNGTTPATEETEETPDGDGETVAAEDEDFTNL